MARPWDLGAVAQLPHILPAALLLAAERFAGPLLDPLAHLGGVPGRGDRATHRAHVRANPGGPPPLRKEPLGRGIPGAGASHRPIGGQRSVEAHLQGGRPDAKEAPGLKRPLHPRSFWLGLGPTTSWRKDRLSGRQELKEASGGGRSKEALGAFAPPVGDRRDLRSTLQHAPACSAGGGGLTTEAIGAANHHSGGENYWHSGEDDPKAWRTSKVADGHSSSCPE